MDATTLRVGNHEILLRVDDGLATDETSIEVRVITAGEAADMLRERVRDAGLPKGRERALLENLKNAIKSFEKGHMETGVRQLRHFQKIVQSVGGRRMDPAAAAALIAQAQEIIDALTGR